MQSATGDSFAPRDHGGAARNSGGVELVHLQPSGAEAVHTLYGSGGSFFFLLYSATMARGMLGSIAALAGWSEGYVRDTYRSVFDTYSYPLAYLRRIRRFRDISGYPSQ
uniref:Uncharacterized protein n=1 Tax=Oryza barthii TaxID=65489 RepID=A0A0D3H419_9ORYZ